MKKSFRIILIVVMLLAVVFTLWACNDDDDVLKSLSAPENVSTIGSTISWNAVNGASKYELILPGATESVSTNNTYYNLDISQIGTYLVKIRAVGENSLGEAIYSAYTEYTFTKSEKLTTPQVGVSGKTVSWGTVSNADSYLIKVLNSEGTVIHEVSQSELSIELTDEKFSAIGKYTIQVKAIPSKPEYANSDAGITYYVVSTTLATPAISNVSTTSIRWTSISGISSYKVYLYKVGQDSELATYTTTSNSYAFSNMKVDEDKDGEVDYCITEKEGTYYCLLQAIGDGEVYKNSTISTRDTTRDLKVISSLTGDITLEKESGSWVLKFTSKNPDQLASFTVSLKTTKADDSASMPAVESSVFITDTDLTYIVATGDFDAQKIYYDEKPAGYVKNLAEKKAGTTYYKFELDTATDTYKYVEYSGTLSSFEDYYIKHDATYYEQAKGVATYVQVGENEAFSTRYNYYIKDGNDYKLVESKYLAGTIDELSEDTTIIYMKDNGDNTFAKIGNIEALRTLYPTDHTTKYWAYKPFTEFEQGVTYYKATYADLTATEYAAGTYYVAQKKQFTQNVDDLFFTINGEEYTYKKSDIAYYGKTYTITVTPKGAKDTVLPGSAVVCDDQYVSYRKPTKITDTASPFVGYYKVESLGDLQYIAYEPNAKYVQMKDLDAEGYVWTPIPLFSGTYDGNNHMISNIVYGKNENSGLFAACASATTIQNVYIVNASNVANPTGTVGGIVGVATQDLSIANCYVKGAFSDAKVVGGIVGVYATPTGYSALIRNCQADVTIKNVAAAGGIIYDAAPQDVDGITIDGCIAIGSITSNDPYFKLGDFEALDNSGVKYGIKDDDNIYKYENSTYVLLGTYSNRNTDAFKDANGKYYSAYYFRMMSQLNEPNRYGGIAGKLINALVMNTIAAVQIDVKATDLDIKAGGFAGETLNCAIANSYTGAKYTRDSKDLITITSSGSELSCTGGFIGAVDATSIMDCYTTAKAFGRDNVGGFVGYVDGTNTVITRCYSAGGTVLFDGKSINVTEGTTYTNNFVYLAIDKDKLPSIPHAGCFNSFDELYDALKSAAAGVAKIADYKEPCLLDNIYTSAYSDKIKASGVLSVKTYIATDNAGEIEIIDMFENKDKAESIIIGDKTAKGTILWVLQEKGVAGRRVVIYVTVS